MQQPRAPEVTTPLDFAGTVVLVTGAGRNLGAGVAMHGRPASRWVTGASFVVDGSMLSGAVS